MYIPKIAIITLNVLLTAFPSINKKGNMLKTNNGLYEILNSLNFI